MAAEPEPRHKRARTRSPSYPYLALPDALEKAAALWRAESRHAVSVSVAMQHWGYKAESSTGFSCIAALKKFALVDEEGVGERREVKLSKLALTMILDEADSPERKSALRASALSPSIHAELWERYGADLPSDQSLKRFLVVEKNFNEGSVEEFLAEYRATVVFAGLSATAGEESHAGPMRTAAPPPPSRALVDESLAAPRGDAVPRPGLGPPRVQRPNGDHRPTAGSLPPRADQAGRLSSLPPGGKTAPPPVVTPIIPAGNVPPASLPTGAGATVAEHGGGHPGNEVARELLVPFENDQVARVPYPMSEDDFALFIDTLQLWKKRLVRPSRAN